VSLGPVGKERLQPSVNLKRAPAIFPAKHARARAEARHSSAYSRLSTTSKPMTCRMGSLAGRVVVEIGPTHGEGERIIQRDR
jgi:hypothetical protein